MSHTKISHIFLTGTPGVGKTTLVKRICEYLQQHNVPVSGFYTEEKRTGGQRIGFDVVTLNKERVTLASCQTRIRGPTVGKYTVDVSSFESCVLPLLDCSTLKKGILVIDEIGKMELFSDKFKRKVTSILISEGDITVFGTIPIKRGRGIPFVENIREQKNVRVFEISKENRDSIFDEINDAIMKCLQ